MGVKIGSTGVCQKCDGRIRYNGEDWYHRTGEGSTHKAQPKAIGKKGK